MVPGARIELAQRLTPRDFKSLASTYSATQAININILSAISWNVNKAGDIFLRASILFYPESMHYTMTATGST